MAGLIPFNRKNNSLARVDTGFEDFYNMLDDFFNDDWFARRSLMSDTFKVDVREDEKQYMIEADVPGIKKEEIALSLDKGRLTLMVNRTEEEKQEEQNYIHRERRSSSMQRSIYLANADEQNVNAKLEDGVLRIIVGKQNKELITRRIEIE